MNFNIDEVMKIRCVKDIKEFLKKKGVKIEE